MMSWMVFRADLEGVGAVVGGCCSSSLLSSVAEYMSQLPVEDREMIERLRSLGQACGWRLSLTQSLMSSLREALRAGGSAAVL